MVSPVLLLSQPLFKLLLLSASSHLLLSVFFVAPLAFLSLSFRVGGPQLVARPHGVSVPLVGVRLTSTPTLFPYPFAFFVLFRVVVDAVRLWRPFQVMVC